MKTILVLVLLLGLIPFAESIDTIRLPWAVKEADAMVYRSDFGDGLERVYDSSTGESHYEWTF